MSNGVLAVPGSIAAVQQKLATLAEDLAAVGVVTYPMEKVRAHMRLVVRSLRRESGRWRFVWPLAWLYVRFTEGRGGVRAGVVDCVCGLLYHFGRSANVLRFQNAGAQWHRIPYAAYQDAVPQGVQGVLFRAFQVVPDTKVFVHALDNDPFLVLERQRGRHTEEACIGYWNAPGFTGIMDQDNSA